MSRKSMDALKDGEFGSLIEATYQRPCQDIVAGRYPPASKLRLAELSEAYGVSTGTVREALSLLVSERLVTPFAQRGFRVVPMSLDDFTDVTRVRVAMEASALEECIVSGDDNWETGVVAAFHRLRLAEKRFIADPGTFGDWEECNRAFHDALVSACTSEWTLRFRGMLYRHSERYRRLLSRNSTDLSRERVHKEHTEIFELVLDRDVAGAVRVATKHIETPLELARAGGLLSVSAIGSALKKSDQ